jgi:hypothetical protein
VELLWLLAIGVPSVIFAAFQNEGQLGERWTLLRGERRLVPLVVIATLLAMAVSLPISLTTRADPRTDDPAQLTEPLLDPIEAILALQALDPARPLYAVEGADPTPLPAQWRVAALDVYDGRRWSPSIALRPIGRRLGPATGPTVDIEIRVLAGELRLIPLPGSPVTVDAPIETNAARTIVRLIEPVDPSERIAVTSNVAPTAADTIGGGLATRPVDESVSGLTELANNLGGTGTVIEQLRTIEQTMRNDFVLDSDAPGGGLQRALIDRFLRDTRRGNSGGQRPSRFERTRPALHQHQLLGHS